MTGLVWETGSPVSQVLARSSDLSTQQTCLLRSTTISVMTRCRILARCCPDHNTTCSACSRSSCCSLTHLAACQPPPLSAYTQAYDVKGFFTGVRSRVTIHKPAAVVYQSLSTNLHHVFTPMTVSWHALACYNVCKVCCEPCLMQAVISQCHVCRFVMTLLRRMMDKATRKYSGLYAFHSGLFLYLATSN